MVLIFLPSQNFLKILRLGIFEEDYVPQLAAEIITD
jgi:hypothetical protein